MCNKCNKVFYSGTGVIDQTVAANAPIAINKVYSSGISDFGVNSFTISEAGFYLINFSASGAPAAAGDVSVQLYLNGSAQDAYVATATSTGATDSVNVDVNAIIRVDPTVCKFVDNSVTVSLVNVGAATIYSSASITCVRV